MNPTEKPSAAIESNDNLKDLAPGDFVRASREACNTALSSRRLTEFCVPEVAEKFCNRWSLDRLDKLVKNIVDYDGPRMQHFFPSWATNLRLHERESQARELDERLAKCESYNEGMGTLLELWSRVTNMHPKHQLWMHLMEEKQGYVYNQSLVQTLPQLARFSDFEIAEDRDMHRKLLTQLRFGAEKPTSQAMFLSWAGTPPEQKPPNIL